MRHHQSLWNKERESLQANLTEHSTMSQLFCYPTLLVFAHMSQPFNSFARIEQGN